MGKKNNIIIFDMAGKEHLPSYSCLLLAPYLTSRGYDVEYCDLSRISFKLFAKKYFIFEILKEFEKELAKNSTTSQRMIRFYLKEYAKRILSRYRNDCYDEELTKELYVLFCLLLGAKHHYINFKVNKPKKVIINDLFNHLILRDLYNKNKCNLMFARLFFNSDEFQELIKNKIKDKQVLCFSLLYSHQNALFKILARNIKKEFPDKKIIIGGQGVKEHWKSSLINKKYLECCDFAIIGEGEKPLLKLLGYFKGSYKLKDVPNIVYLQKNKIKANKFDYFHNLDDLPPPYWNKRQIKGYKLRYLNYETGRGCSRQKCTFCRYNFGLKSPYRKKDPKKIISELKILKRETGIPFFKFINEGIDIGHALEISKEIIRKKLNIKWETWIRFDDDWISLEKLVLLKKSGCSALRFGLESGDERMNRFVGKCVSIAKVVEFIKLCKKIGIQVVLFTMVGFPCESISSVLRTINFIRTNREYLFRSYVFIFRAFPYIPMANKKEEYGIKKLINAEGEFIAYRNNFFRMHLLKPLLFASSYLLSNKEFKLQF